MLTVNRPFVTPLLATCRSLRNGTKPKRFRSTRAARKVPGHVRNRQGFALTKFVSPIERATFLKAESFIPWLISRLEMIEKTCSDHGYATFIRNFASILPDRSIWEALEARDRSVPSSSEWRPSEQTRPLSLLISLREAFKSQKELGIETQLKYSYHGLLASRKFSQIDLEDQEKLADIRHPAEWYPATRAIQRKIILHVGPTNSGKTYHALQRLEQAKSGIYAGPLRLLAHEVYMRLNAKRRPCDLVTGDERAAHDGAEMQSCTVEMVPLNADVDVAVIDEIQMIGHRERGWAWTQALLGLKAKEIHLCGEARSVPLIRELVASIGDEIEVHTYERLSPLKTMSTSLNGRLSDLRKGDCLVVFTRLKIHAMKAEIEKLTGKRVAVVYGSLPPEIRAQQAKLFNDPDNDYDIIVASDAIGMGLNLQDSRILIFSHANFDGRAIKRIIFESVSKFNGIHNDVIGDAQLKQIAGRAGRFRTSAQAELLASNVDGDSSTLRAPEPVAPPSLGLVTTLHATDLPILHRAMQKELDPIMSAGLLPPTSVLTKFATYFPPSTSFSYILLRLQELSLQHPRYHLCDLREQTSIADAIHRVENLTIRDRIVICASPASPGQPGMSSVLRAFARCVGNSTSGALLDIPELPLDVLGDEMKIDRYYMIRLESLHKALILYLWLSYRFAGVFVNQAMAFYVKSLVEEKIDKMLTEFSDSPEVMKRLKRRQEKALRQLHDMNEPVAESKTSQSPNDLLAELLSPKKKSSAYQEENRERPIQVAEHLERIGVEVEGHIDAAA